MRNRIILFGGILAFLLAIGNVPRVEGQEVTTCPGRGERCAKVKVLFVSYWKVKDKGGPGVVIKEVK